MIDRLESTVVSMLATYFSVSDLSSLSQVSPALRYLFVRYSWRKVFVIPHKYLKHGTDKAFKMYEYQVISVKMVKKLERYQWIKGSCVQELVFSPMCGFIKKSVIDQINVGDSFPYLQSIYGQSHDSSERNDITCIGTRDYHGSFISKYAGLFSQQESSAAFIDKVVSTAPKSVTIVNLLCESQLQLYNVSNLEKLTSLQVSSANIDSNFVKLTDHLKRCVNLQRFIFTPLLVIPKSQYSLIYSVINKSFPKLKFLKVLHHYASGEVSDPCSNVHAVEELSNTNIEYFEVFVVLQENPQLSDHLHLAQDVGNTCIDLSGIHGLEFGGPCSSIHTPFRYPYFRRMIHAPHLRHFKLNNFLFGQYLQHILVPVESNLTTLHIGPDQIFDLSLFVSSLPKFCNLKNLVVERASDTSYLDDEVCYSLIETKFHNTIGIYDWVYSQIRDGSIGIDEIKQLGDEEVEKLIADILAKGEINLSNGYEDEGVIEKIRMMIKHPESLVEHYDSILKEISDDTSFYYSLKDVKIEVVPFIYSFWDSVFNICKDLTKLEALKVFEASAPFVSPHFSNLVHNHKSEQLKSITIGIAKGLSNFIPSTELNGLSYEKYLYKVKAPFVHRYLEPYMGWIDYVGDVYVVDIELMKKDFKFTKKFCEEEMKYGQGYLDSTFNQKGFTKHYECDKNPVKDARIMTIGSREIQNMDINLGHI